MTTPETLIEMPEVPTTPNLFAERRKIVKKIDPRYANMTPKQVEKAKYLHEKYLSDQAEAEKELATFVEDGMTLLDICKAVKHHKSALSRNNRSATKHYNDTQKTAIIKVKTEVVALKEASRAELKAKVKALLDAVKQEERPAIQRASTAH